MHYFDYEKVARQAHVSPEKLDELGQVKRQDFPREDMMYELHLLRVYMAIREGILTLEEAVRPDRPPGFERFRRTRRKRGTPMHRGGYC